jgi:hypothetical protein
MPDEPAGQDVSIVAVEDFSTWPSLERVVLPTRALLMSWLIQTLPMRRAALADSVAQARALADEPPGAVRDLVVLAVVSDAMQPLEDLAYLATSWSEPLRGLAYYVRATMYSDRTPTNFWGKAHKRDDVFLDVLAGFASPRPDTGEIADVLDTFQAVAGSTPDDEANAAMQLAREATRHKLRMLLPILAEGWKQFGDYFYAYKHGALVVNRGDARWWSDAPDGDEPVEREQPALTAWLRGGKALEGRGEFRLDTKQLIREADDRGRMAIDFTETFVHSRLALFNALVFDTDGSIKGLQPTRLAWTAWLGEAELPSETWTLLGAGPTITWRSDDSDNGKVAP